ncbi:UDP-3-O-(3-hydroxymyristoyl)glucosamine N-acyltransferase [Glaciecola sp. 1036]|uniref:UDP-3-O-(3-hydroxymyristoyl)glucosamine N-acyltransferase n=1 Tax=Alteromonadaceae TaxID=72275 RepID=UPI003D037AD5
MTYTINQIAEKIGGDVDGDGSKQITSMATLASANENQMSFLSNSKYTSDLKDSAAGCVILSAKDAQNFAGNKIVHQNPYVGFALAAQLLDTTPVPNGGISDLADISPLATIGENVHIGPHVTVSDGAVIGDNSVISAGCYIGKNSILGKAVSLKPNVTIYHGVHLGNNVSVHSGTNIGSDGFGYANDKGVWVKIPQTGGVRIGDDTEIGAGTCIDRGALDDTVIGKNCIIDNHVQIAHNVVVGNHSCICGSVGIAGSVTIGNYVVIGGHCGIAGHLSITDKVQITGFTMVTKSITQSGSYSSGMPALPSKDWQRNTVRMRNIDKLFDRVKNLEKGE